MVKKNNLDLEEQQISILLNIPFKTEPVPLDLDAIHHPDLKSRAGLSKNPYITPIVKYSFKMMRELTNSGYSKIISFFFNEKIFKKILYKYSRLPDKDEDESPKNPHSILQYNAMIMLKMIFPTYYPSVQNVTSSLDEYISQKGTRPSYKTLYGFNKMSYVKIDGKIHTITKTVFLNDILNHPVYKNVIKRSNDYFVWSKKQEGTIEKEISTGFDKLKKRIKGDLSIETYKAIFEKEKEKYREFEESDPTRVTRATRATTKVEDDKRMFAESLASMILIISNLYNETITAEEYKSVDNLYESINNMKELYTRITGYNLLSKTPIEFINRVNRLLEESKKLAFISKIWNSYIQTGNINVRIEDENPEILSLLRSKYKPYMDYIDVIRTIIRPSRETSNTKLQESINAYSQNRDSDVKLMDLFTTIRSKYMYVFGDTPASPTSKPISDEMLVEYMNVGVCGINIDEQNKPRYEVQVSMNLIENEYTIDDMNSIKCIYDGLALGKELEDHWDDANPYEVELHAVYISQADIESQKQGTSSKQKDIPPPIPPSKLQQDFLPPPPPVPEKKVQFMGGRTRKLRSSRRNTRRHRRIQNTRI